MDLRLVPYPTNPYKWWGHVTFWNGLACGLVGVLGAVAAGQAYADQEAGDTSAAARGRFWRAVEYSGLAVGGMLSVTGLVLWGLSPGDEAWYAEQVRHGQRVE